MRADLARQEKYWDGEVKDFDAIYTREKGRFARWLDAKCRWDINARYDYTMEHSEPIRGRSFLDVGCGTGIYSMEYLRRGARLVVGIDIAENMLAVCRRRAAEQQAGDNCRFLHTDILQYHPEDEFDVCIGLGLFDYIREPLPVLTRMRELSKDKVIISAPRFWTWRAPLRKLRLAVNGCDVYFYTRTRVDSLVRQAGFASHEIESIGKLYCITAHV